ncbi:UNVERIFIED_ORG: hypothetical protein BDU10_4896 [Burkholderia sp. CF145]|nr:hypothetical protein PMI06_002747 [Burkholderia sp. BT03]SKC66826.1 hypothetical protein SAMN06266956_1593 [Paraburkholderia hospita]
MKKVERTRRARKRCACASPRTSNDAPVRSARPVVSDRMRHARACCGAASRRSGSRRGASRCGRARWKGARGRGRLKMGDEHGQRVAPDEPRVEVNHPLRSPISSTGMRGVSKMRKSVRESQMCRDHTERRAGAVRFHIEVERAARRSRAERQIERTRRADRPPAEDRVSVHADSAIFIASARLNESRIASTSMPVCFSRLQPTAATSFPFSPSSAINSNVSGVPVNFV